MCVCVCGREKKNNGFEITVIILQHVTNVNLLFKKDFKNAGLLTKTSFFFALDITLKMTQKTKKKVASICVMHQKRWRKLKLI